jgi:hypothetical protein
VYVHAALTSHARIPATADPEPSGILVRGQVPMRDHVLPALRELCALVAPHGLDRATGCFVGARWDATLAARRIRDTVDGQGWRWIDPEAFLYYSPHTLAAAVCVDHLLRGPSMTFVGDAADAQALEIGALQCRTGNCPAALVLGIEVVSGAAGRSGPVVVRLAATVLSVMPGPAVLSWNGGTGPDPVPARTVLPELARWWVQETAEPGPALPALGASGPRTVRTAAPPGVMPADATSVSVAREANR